MRVLAALLVICLSAFASAEPLRIATFVADATPPLGSPVAYAPARSVQTPLTARGVVLIGEGKPIVICAVDWIIIANGSQEAWRQQLAEAAGTTPDRVAVHVLHQHDGVRSDFTTEAILAEHGLAGRRFDVAADQRAIASAADALRHAIKQPLTATHLSVGKAKVEKVASNRRVLGEDGKVAMVRWSKMTDPRAQEAPEGTIDPSVRVLGFWNNKQPLAALTYYACHPQSYYGKGDVNSEFVGLARQVRQDDTGVPHIYFNGAGGNVTAGKYNNGSAPMRLVLALRLAEGMKQAWDTATKQPITAADVRWTTTPVLLPVAEHLDAARAGGTLKNDKADINAKLNAAGDLAFIRRTQAGKPIDIACLKIGNAYVLHMPGELFVEYQLAAQQMRPDAEVCMAAYGDGAPGYIGTAVAYTQGGYETSPRATNVAPGVEQVLTDAMRKLLAD